MILINVLLLLLALVHLAYTLQDSLRIPIQPFLNNKGASGPGSDFDGAGTYFQCSQLSNTNLTVGNIDFSLPSTTTTYDNVLCQGQILTLSSWSNKQLGALYVLGAAHHGPLTTDLTLVYKDGTQVTTTVNLPDWQTPAHHLRRFHQPLDCQLSNGATGQLFAIPLLVDSSRAISHLVLPDHGRLGSFRPALHIFAITGISTNQPLVVISARGTRRWKTLTSYPIVNVLIQNTGTDWMRTITISVSGELLRTEHEGRIDCLGPGQLMSVDVAVHHLRRRTRRMSVLIEVTANDKHRAVTEITNVEIVDLVDEAYEASEGSLQGHEAPDWFESAKFGIFVHWGLYAVPSWAPVGAEYAEWYWWNYHQTGSATFKYHRRFYGPDIEYDDFLKVWRPKRFDPWAWMDLIDASGATYFVFTAKHHDGIALFDTQVTNRSTVHLLSSRRDFVKELMEVAERNYSHLKRGIYFSLPEWYHPSYRDDWLHWQGPPINPYTKKRVPYTGSSHTVSDFVNQIQVPQIMELIEQHQPDILWCDIGGINNSTVWQAEFFNRAKQQGREVTVNDRCGNSVSDFETVEYKEINHVPSRFWESTRGIDPHSFGFNHQTKTNQYASTLSLIQELVSVVSRGGNFLLNIGPDGSGYIPDVMQVKLLEIGAWIDRVKESIFDTVPYWVTPSDFSIPGQPLYFTQSRLGCFYIFSLNRPTGRRLVVRTKVPLHPQSKISLLPTREYLNWEYSRGKILIIHVPEHVVDQETLLWVFKIQLV
ncbi:MAG: alpha-L-fucosidase-domain-containing protein [Benjaminiella poitrasii]|nr:MAG: alpha-L-fucosidase-domain-containing protein [Benjaminiella poitrasii]